MVSSLEKFNTFVSKDDGWGDIGKYHEPNPDHMTPGFGKPNAKSTVPKNTGDFNHQFETIQTQPHSVTFNYQGGVKAVHENHYNKADHVAQQSYHVKQAKVAKTAGDTTKSIGHTNAAAAHGYQSRNMVQPGHDTLTESRGITHHGYYDDNPAMPWVGKADTDTYRKKLLNNPDIVPPQGQTKEEVVDGMINQKIRQRKNNKRANNLLNAEIADPGGGAKAGGDSAMYRLTSFVQKPIEAADDGTPPIWGEPKESHIKKANRLIEYIDIDPDKVKLDDPPKYKDKVHKKELQLIKSYSEKLKDDEFIDEVNIQDEDLEEPFYRYLRDNELRIDKDIMKQINRDTSSLVHKFKIFYNRPRPHQVDDDIKEIDNIAGKSPSYPSGHSTNSYVMGEYLANKFPEHADELRNIGKRVGLNRVIVGLHHPTDHMAGVKLGEQIVRTIPGMDDVKKSDAFMDELFKYMAHREELFKDMTQIGGQDILDGVRIDKEDNPRVPRKEGQPAKSDKHSDLYTDEDPKDTITGLGFKDDETVKASVTKIKSSDRTHAHKIQAAVAMEQRAKAAGKSSEAGIYRKFIDSMKKKTQEMEKHTEEHHTVEHISEEKPFSMDDAKESLAEQIKQIKNKIETGSYGIEKSEDIFLKKAPDYTFDKFLTSKQFDEFENFAEFKKYKEDFLTALDAKVNAFQGEDTLKNTFKSAVGDTRKRLNKLNESNFNISGKKIYEQLDRINRLDDLLKEPEKPNAEKPNAEEPKANKSTSKKPTKKSTAKKSTANKSTAKKPTPKKDTPKKSTANKSTNKSTKSTKTEVEEFKLKTAHQNRINKIQETRQEVTKHLDAFNKEKNTFKKFGHEEKFKNAIKEYEKAKDVETEYRASQEKRGTAQPDATKGQDYMDAPTAPKYTSEERLYIDRRNKLIDLARKKELGKKHYEQNHSSEFDTHYGNEEAAEAELFNQPNDKLAAALKRLDTQPEEKPPTSEGTKVVGKPSSTQLRAQEKNIMDQVQGISDEYFDKDLDGSFKIKDNLDKHDVILGMKKLQRITEEEWKGDNNEFNRNEDGSITDNDNGAAKQANRQNVLGNKSFSTVSAVGASFRTQGLQNKFGMDKKQSQKIVDSIKNEYEQKDTDFMNPNTEEGKKHIAESEDRSEYEASLKDHEEYKDATNWGKGRPEGKGDDGLHGSKLFNTDEAKESQKPKTAGEVATKDMQLQQSPKYQEMSESTKINYVEVLDSPRRFYTPMFQGEEENETVQGVWHPETGRWAKPDTISGATGHFASMKDNTMMHLTGKEFDDAQGKIVPDKDGVTGGTKHNRTGEDIIAHKDNDGKMTYHTTSSGELDRFGHRRLSGPSDRAKAKREAAMDAIVMEIKNDSKKTPFGGKKTYSTDGIKGVLSYKGGVEFKPRKFQFNPAGVRDKIGDGASRITRRASASLQRFGDRAASNIKNEDAYKLIREAKGKKKTLGRKPNMNINSPNNRARLDKFNTEQLTELKNHINFFRGGE